METTTQTEQLELRIKILSRDNNLTEIHGAGS